MATGIPAPPFLGPLQGVPVAAATPDTVEAYVLRWNAAGQFWGSLDWPQQGWQTWPSGYYADAKLDSTDQTDWQPDTTVIVVKARSDKNGVAQPFVLEQPPAGQAPNPQCPPNMYLTDLGSQFSQSSNTLCSWLPPQSTTQVCPPGTHWDPVTETCIADTVPPLPIPIPPTSPPPPPPPPSPVSQPDPYGDEITNTLCAQMAANAAAIVAAINALSQPGANQETCCASIVTAIASVTQTLNGIFQLLITRLSARGAPLDLTPVVTELTAIAQSLAAIATAPALDLTPLTAAINDIARAIASAPPADVSGIVQQLKTIADQGDVDQGIIDAMAQAGFITSGDQQVLQGIKWSDAISWVTGGAPIRAVTNAVKKVGADEVAIVTSIANYLAPDINWAEQKVQAALSAERNILLTPIKALIEKVKSALTPVGAITVGGIGVDPDKALADVATAMLDLKLMAILIAHFREGVGEQFSKLSEKILALVGLDEINEVQLGPLVRHGIAKVAEFQAKAQYRQELPGASSLAGMQARGLIAPGLLAALYPSTGLPSVLEAATTQGAYSGFNARQMLRLAGTGLFTDQDIADELTFSGLRPVSQHRFMLAAPYLATQPQRNQLKAAYEAQYRFGLINNVNLVEFLDQTDQNMDRNNLIVKRLDAEILVDETKLLLAEYTQLFKAGIYTDAQYRGQLAAIGLEQWKIDLEAGKAESAANVASFKKNLAEAAREERATVAEERKAAMQSFKTGATNAPGLAAALTLTGLTPIQAAAWVALATLQRGGSLRWIYGLLKSPAEASLLRARVTALADQRKRLQIDDATFVGALQALQIPDRYINSLRAATDAMISPKTAAVTIPVNTT